MAIVPWVVFAVGVVSLILLARHDKAQITKQRGPTR
jgi:hypothetical protein